MTVPYDLQEAIDREIAQTPLSQLAKCSEDLSFHYRSPSPVSFLHTQGHRHAYLAVRLPATYAAIEHVLIQIKKRLPSFSPSTLLDIGAGPGTGMWAAREVFPSIARTTLLEKDASFIALGKRLAKEKLEEMVWRSVDLSQSWEEEPHDLVLFSYCIGEIAEKHWESLFEKLIALTKHTLVVIEPGTPLGFERIRKIRDRLIRAKLYMLAPCPHVATCPMEKNDWCHFAQRVARTAIHRKTKEGSLNYEDEKFSYVAMSKHASSPIEARIVARPEKSSGHVRLTLCSASPISIEKKTISRKDKEKYRLARDAKWGDKW